MRRLFSIVVLTKMKLVGEETIIKECVRQKYKNEARSDLHANYVGKSVLPVAVIEVTRKTINRLAEMQDVLHIIPNKKIDITDQRIEVYEPISDMESRSGLTWGLEELEAPRMWEITKGEGVNVAVIDSGADAKHIALKNRIKKFISINNRNTRTYYSTAYDKNSHGTHVCGTIAGSKTKSGVHIGMAPRVNLFVVSLPYPVPYISNMLNALSWAVEQNADIINISMGWSTDYQGYIGACYIFNRIVTHYGVLPIVSTGNMGWGMLRFPANAFSALSIGSIYHIFDRTLPREDRNQVASNSSGGSFDFPEGWNPDRIVKPDVVAPGVRVYSCLPSKGIICRRHPYGYMQGTSMAAPHVTGAAALLLSANPGRTPSEIADALKRNAWHPHGNRRPDNRWGYGLIRLFRTHEALQ